MRIIPPAKIYSHKKHSPNEPRSKKSEKRRFSKKSPPAPTSNRAFSIFIPASPVAGKGRPAGQTVKFCNDVTENQECPGIVSLK
jgi:hypothetical protein